MSTSNGRWLFGVTSIVATLAVYQTLSVHAAPQTATQHGSPLGQELAVPRHLADGEEFSTPLTRLLAHGKLLFEAIWTEQDGGGRPLTKGTGRPLADLAQPLKGSRAFNRISGPDANSCAGCHNMPYGISGGSGE